MMEIGRQILISNMEKEKTSGDFRKLFVLIHMKEKLEETNFYLSR